MMAGLFLLFVTALSRPGVTEGARFLATGFFAALVASTCGSVVGLIFGIPETAGRTQIIAKDAAEGRAAVADTGDWFVDNSSLERIATWLTGAIIALTLANFNAWMDRFDTASISIGHEMWGQSSGDAAPLEAAVRRAEDQLRTVLKDSGAKSAAKTAAVRDAVDQSRSALNRLHATDHGAWGGVLLGFYGLLGFLVGYLWTRRFLAVELAWARKELRDVQRADSEAMATTAAAWARGDIAAPKLGAAESTEAASALVNAARAALPVTAPFVPGAPLPPDIVEPGNVPKDPWKGQFGGKSARGGFILTAQVVPDPSGSQYFAISLRIIAQTPEARARSKVTDVRVYLHPTFPAAIRVLQFSANGEIAVPLLSYGSFTVGIQFLDNGDELELDLATLPDVPANFRDQ